MVVHMRLPHQSADWLAMTFKIYTAVTNRADHPTVLDDKSAISHAIATGCIPG